MELKFDEKGLIPAIVQDHYTKEVLTLAYMNAETLALTIAEGRTVFWSRSRQEIWRKGDTSGNVQHVVSITADCDKDALVVEVVKDGPACHTGAESCFFNEVYVSPELKQFSWQGLYELIKGRNPCSGCCDGFRELSLEIVLVEHAEHLLKLSSGAAGFHGLLHGGFSPLYVKIEKWRDRWYNDSIPAGWLCGWLMLPKGQARNDGVAHGDGPPVLRVNV